MTENQTRKLESLRDIKTRVGNIRLPAPDINPVNTVSLDRSLASLTLYLGLAAGKIRSQGGTEKFVLELLALRDAVGDLQRLIAENGERAGLWQPDGGEASRNRQPWSGHGDWHRDVYAGISHRAPGRSQFAEPIWLEHDD